MRTIFLFAFVLSSIGILDGNLNFKQALKDKHVTDINIKLVAKTKVCGVPLGESWPTVRKQLTKRGYKVQFMQKQQIVGTKRKWDVWFVSPMPVKSTVFRTEVLILLIYKDRVAGLTCWCKNEQTSALLEQAIRNKYGNPLNDTLTARLYMIALKTDKPNIKLPVFVLFVQEINLLGEDNFYVGYIHAFCLADALAEATKNVSEEEGITGD